MIINGKLDLGDSSIESLGDLKEVKGNLDLRGANVAFLPRDLKITGLIYLYRSTIYKKFKLNNFYYSYGFTLKELREINVEIFK